MFDIERVQAYKEYHQGQFMQMAWTVAKRPVQFDQRPVLMNCMLIRTPGAARPTSNVKSLRFMGVEGLREMVGEFVQLSGDIDGMF